MFPVSLFNFHSISNSDNTVNRMQCQVKKAQKKKKTGNIASCLLSFSDRVLNEFFWVK
jgi:hypothetical protein